MVRIEGLEPTQHTLQDPKSCASTNSAISANRPLKKRSKYNKNTILSTATYFYIKNKSF